MIILPAKVADVAFIALVADMTSVPAILSTPLFCMFKLWSIVTSPSKNVVPVTDTSFAKVASPVPLSIVNLVVSTFVPTPILKLLVEPSYLIDAPFCGLAVVPSCNKILEVLPAELVFMFNVGPAFFDIITSPAKVAF